MSQCFRQSINKDGNPQQGTFEPELKFVPSLSSGFRDNCLTGKLYRLHSRAVVLTEGVFKFLMQYWHLAKSATPARDLSTSSNNQRAQW